MTRLVSGILRNVNPDAVVKRGLKKEGCAVSLEGAPDPRVIVDFDRSGLPLGERETKCDYLLAAGGDREPGWLVLLELKRGRLDASNVVRQLRAGAGAAENLVPVGETVRFRPVAVTGNTPKAERQKLRKIGKIWFRGHQEDVRLMSCGAQIAGLLSR